MSSLRRSTRRALRSLSESTRPPNVFTARCAHILLASIPSRPCSLCDEAIR
jgi:hypothetical protein